jgi:tRNA nucleotidyltransferase (CCA-adding enzyme)
MNKYFEAIPKELRDLIGKIREQALAQGLKVYLVGGFVRDLILAVENLDLDIVVEGDGIKFAEHFVKPQGGRIIVHKHFGTATVLLPYGIKIDFSSARKETYPKPAHLPVVSPGSLKDDLLRRDFTINAMAISLSDGAVVDYFGGQDDLRNKKIRVLHDLSFKDDPTRILRGIRFEQRFNFSIEPKTLKLLKEAIKLRMLEKVQPHRTRDDLVLVLKENNPLANINRIKQLVGFKFIHPKLKLTLKSRRYLKSLEKEIKWFNKNYPQRRGLDAWLIYLIGLLDSLSPQEIRDVCEKFGLRKGEEKRLLGPKQVTRKFIVDLSNPKIKPARIFALLNPLSYETVIALRAKYKNLALKRHIADFLEIYNGMCIFVSGDDLHCLGLSPGPRYQEIFTLVLNAKLNGEVENKEEELLLIKKLLGEIPPAPPTARGLRRDSTK